MRDRRSAMLRCWHALEMFEPQGVPDVKHRGVHDATEGPLPWERAQEPPEEGKVHRYNVFFGMLDVRDLVNVLDRWGVGAAEAEELRPDKATAVAACQVSEDGRLIEGSFALSTCAWAVGRCRNEPPTAERLVGFDDAQHRASEELYELLRAHGTDPDDLRVYRPVVDGLIAYLRSTIGLADFLDRGEVRVECRQVFANASVESDLDFLNSFLLDDLRMVERRTSGGEIGAALARYLDEHPDSIRHDVRQDSSIVLAGTRPALVPDGRWPAALGRNLVTSQQFALNHIIEQLAEGSGLVAVNGPPGTGKTTLLRDLIADIFVQRASAIVTLDDPGSAFVDTSCYVNERGRWPVHHWRPDLVGYEIAVASSNNGAVENVVNEIPGVAAVDDRWLGEVDYFADIASDVLAAARENGDQDAPATRPRAPEAWSLMAARLGRRANRSAFVTAFWFPPKGDSETRARRGRGLKVVLDDYVGQPGAESWGDAVRRFREAKAYVARLRQERVPAGEALRELPAAAQRRDTARSAVEEATQVARDLRSPVNTAGREVEQATLEERAKSAKLRAHVAGKPPFWRRIGREWTTWKSEHRRRLEELARCAVRIADAAGGHQRAIEQHELAINQLRVRQDEHRAESATHDRLLAVVEDARRIRGDAVPEPGVAPDPTASPWMDDAWSEARTRLFLAALRLHHDFLRIEAKRMRANLNLAVDILKGSAPRDLSEPAALAAWQSLFFVVPVISTTFASLGRVFSHLGTEKLGWLFVDEAGQATPQYAVGGLWRARRAVLVGDPLQLEPIESLTRRGREALRSVYGAPEEATDDPRSAQMFGDRRAVMGTWIGSTWVGAPLTVHRRCDDPMFGIVNTVAYDGMMVDGVDTRPEPTCADGSVLAPSRWLDVRSADSQGGTGAPTKAASSKGVSAPFRTVDGRWKTSSSSGPSGTSPTSSRRSADGSGADQAAQSTPLRARRPTSSSSCSAATPPSPAPRAGPPRSRTS